MINEWQKSEIEIKLKINSMRFQIQIVGFVKFSIENIDVQIDFNPFCAFVRVLEHVRTICFEW